MRKFWLEALICTSFVFSLLYGISNLVELSVLDVFDPIGQALGDTELTDVVFSQLREDPPIDTNILIVNIGYLSRIEVAQQINNISKYKPRVIAIDAFYNCPNGWTDSLNCPNAYDTLSLMIFADAIERAGNVVMVTKLLQTDSLINTLGDVALYDSIEKTDDFLSKGAYLGYANLETDAENQEDLKSCRRFNPSIQMLDGTTEYAFGVQTAMLYDSVKTKKFLARNLPLEVINYRANIIDPYGASAYSDRYFTLDCMDALDTSRFVSGLVKDKIVMFGFLGADLYDTSWDDKFFTPLNKKFAGKARPDMYGLVVHANIVSMILNEDYVNEMADWQKYVIAFIVCLLNVAVFMVISSRIPIWFDALALFLQLLQILICSALMVFVFNKINLKLDLTITMAILAIIGNAFELYVSIAKRLWNKFMTIIGFPEKENEYRTQ